MLQPVTVVSVLGMWLVVVPGDAVVTARCDGCRVYFNLREMAEFSLGGRYNTYSGTCGARTSVCEGSCRFANRKLLTWLLETSDLLPVPPVEWITGCYHRGHRG